MNNFKAGVVTFGKNGSVEGLTYVRNNQTGLNARLHPHLPKTASNTSRPKERKSGINQSPTKKVPS